MGRALHIVNFQVPSIIDPRAEVINLLCDYDLDGSELYSVQWYKDGIEFFKFTPFSSPPGYFYDGSNIFVDIKQSDEKRVTLVNKNRRGKIHMIIFVFPFFSYLYLLFYNSGTKNIFSLIFNLYKV